MTQILEAHMQMVQMQLARQQQETRQFQERLLLLIQLISKGNHNLGMVVVGCRDQMGGERMRPSFLQSNFRVFCFINFSLKHLAAHLIWLYIIT